MKNKLLILMLFLPLIALVFIASASAVSDPYLNNASGISKLVSFWGVDGNDSVGLSDLFSGAHNLSVAGDVFNSSYCKMNSCLKVVNDLTGVNPPSRISTNGILFNQSNYNNLTLEFWFNISGVNTTSTLLSRGVDSSCTAYIISTNSSGSMFDTFSGSSALMNNTFTISQSLWHQLFWIWNDTGYFMYIDGNLINITSTAWNSNINFKKCGSNDSFGDYHTTIASTQNVTYDEIMLFNKTLSAAEMSGLFNFNFTSSFIAINNLTYNQTTYVGNREPFSVNITYNSAYYTALAFGLIYNSSGDFVNYGGSQSGAGDNIILNSTVHIPEINTINGFSQTNYFYWMFRLANSSGFNFWQNSSLYSQTVTGEEGQSYNPNTTVLATENFGINISYNSSSYSAISAILTYNNSNYTGIETGSGDNIIFNSSITIPQITTQQQNNSFFWNIILVNANGNNFFTSNKYNQSVSLVNIDNCTANTIRLINYTLYDEDSLGQIIAGPSLNTTVQVSASLYDSSNTLLVTSFNNSYSNISSIQLCISSKTANNYIINTQIKYKASGYVTKYYNQQQVPLSSALNSNISLYDLLVTRSQEFAIAVKDENRILLNNVLVNIQRQYLPLGTFLTVEIPATDGGGTIGHFVLSDEIYNIYIYQGQTLLGTFLNYRPVCQNQAAGQCSLELDLTGVNIIPNNNPYTGLGVSYNQSYNTVTRAYSVNFQSLDGTPKTLVLNVSMLSPNINNNICTQSFTSSVGTLLCSIPSSFGNGTGYASVTVNGNLLYNEEFAIPVSYSALFGYNIFFFAAILVLVLPLMAITNGPLVLVFFIVGIVVAGSMFALNLGNMIGAGSALLWLVVATLILLYKVFSGRQP